jgi:hypothetical protein
LNKYQVIIAVGMPLGSEDFDVEADGHRAEASVCAGAPPFIVFYRNLPLAIVPDPLAPAHAPLNPAVCICGWEVDGFTAPELAPDKLAGHVEANNEASTPAAVAHLEVFRAPLHALLAVKLLDDDEEEDEPEVHP